MTPYIVVHCASIESLQRLVGYFMAQGYRCVAKLEKPEVRILEVYDSN